MSGRAAWTVAGSVILAPSILLGAYNVAALVAHGTSDVTRRFPAAAVERVEVDGGAGNVTITGSDVDTIGVTVHVETGLRPTGHSEGLDGGVLRLRSTCPSIGSNFCRTDYTVSVPRSVALDVRNNGAVTIEGIDGPLDASVSGGSLTVSDATHVVSLTAHGGSIRATAISGPDLSLAARDGSITAALTRVPDTFALSATGGDVTVEIPPTPPMSLSLAVHGGSSDVSVANDPASGRSLSAVVRDGDLVIRPAR